MNLTSVFSRNKDLFSFISRPWYKENIERQRITCTARDLGEPMDNSSSSQLGMETDPLHKVNPALRKFSKTNRRGKIGLSGAISSNHFVMTNRTDSYRDSASGQLQSKHHNGYGHFIIPEQRECYTDRLEKIGTAT